MSRPVSISDTITVHPTGVADDHAYASVSNITNGYAESSNTSYATINLTTGTNATTYIYFTFDFSSIPAGATIDSVSCTAKAYINTTNSSRITTRQIQLYSGTTAKGSASTVSNSTTAFSMTTGTWTRNELQNARIRLYGVRGTSNTTSSYYFRFYGATFTVNYSYSGTQYIITATSEIQDITVSPAVQTALNGESVSFTITPNDNEPGTDFTVLDNDTDVTNSLIEQTIGGDGSVSAVPGSNVTTGHARSSGVFYQSSSTSSDAWLRYAIGHSAESPYSTSNTSNTYSKDGTNDATTQGWMIYPFDFSSIPINATIVSVQVKCYGATESTSETARHADISLWSGDTQKGSTQAFTSTSNSTITLSNVGTWTREELQNARLRFGVGYYGGRLLGVTWTVNYTAPIETIYTYTLSNLAADHEIVISQVGAFIPPDEDPQKTYYPITVSSINALTNPENGTVRVQEGTTETITISPIDPQLTLALDNGVDITNQLVGGTPTNTYTIETKVSGASYGFNLNSSTGYYVSSNNGVSKSASVARINMNFESDCLVTITYINYAEADYDYGMFGKLDTAVATDGLTAASGGSSPSDSTSNYQIPKCSNSSSTQTVSYQIPMGEHFIDVKYGKDDASDAGNDSLQWKITSIEATSAGGDYTYTLSNINQKHSLVFIFGDVDYYFITSSGNSCKLYPDGQVVKLENDSYMLRIVPNDSNATVTLRDNNVDRTSLLEYESAQDKYGNTIVNYIYKLTNITAAHTLTVSCSSGGEQSKVYIKINGTWTQFSKIYKKVNGSWVEQDNSDWLTLFDTRTNYRLMQN